MMTMLLARGSMPLKERFKMSLKAFISCRNTYDVVDLRDDRYDPALSQRSEEDRDVPLERPHVVEID